MLADSVQLNKGGHCISMKPSVLIGVKTIWGTCGTWEGGSRIKCYFSSTYGVTALNFNDGLNQPPTPRGESFMVIKMKDTSNLLLIV